MKTPGSALAWRDYHAKRWERNRRDSTLQLALFYQFLAHVNGELP